MKPVCKINFYGDKEWWVNGYLHREDGPALESISGSKYWFLNDKLHREDGPAIEYANGYREWYYQDKKIDCENNQEFLRIIKLKMFL